MNTCDFCDDPSTQLVYIVSEGENCKVCKACKAKMNMVPDMEDTVYAIDMVRTVKVTVKHTSKHMAEFVFNGEVKAKANGIVDIINMVKVYAEHGWHPNMVEADGFRQRYIMCSK